MKYLLIAFLFIAQIASGAVGDLIGLEVETNGWVMRATISGLNTNGMFYNGFLTNGTPSTTNKLTVYVSGAGYVGTTPTTQGRILYATKHLRFPYPLEQTNDFNAQGSDVVIRLALSEYVNIGDTVTATALAGYFASTNGTGTNANAFTAQTVTNSSTLISPTPFGKWAVVPMQQITNSTMRVKSSDWHWAGKNGSPVAAVKFVANDENGNTNTVTVTSLTWDAGLRAAVYIADMDISAFTNGSKIAVNRTVYPWVGTNLFQTTNGAHTTSPYYTLTNLCDRTRQYGNAYALVDVANGSANGVVVSHTNWNPSAVPVPFLTIDAALVACKLSNSIWFGHLDLGGAIIVLTNGSYTFTGASGSHGTNARTLTTITRHPSASRLATIIGNQSGNTGAGYWLRIHGINNTNNSSLNYWCSGGFTWWDDCLIRQTGTSFQYGEFGQYATGCTISNQTQGWRGYGSRSGPTPLFAGNDTYVFQYVDAYAVIGNVFHECAQSGGIADTHANNPDPVAVGGVIYNNRLFRSGTTTGTIYTSATNHIGLAFVQNIVEQTNNSGPIVSMHGDGVTNPAVQFLIWNNTILGQRLNYAYNDTQVTANERSYFSFIGNFIDDYNIKTDLFNGSPSPSGNRIGNWASLDGVMQFWNVKAETLDVGADNEFLNTDSYGFDGLFTIKSVVSTNWPAFTDRKAYDGANILRGLGNYRLKTTSPMFRISGSHLISHDIDGVPRGMIDPPNGFSSGNAKKGAFF